MRSLLLVLTLTSFTKYKAIQNEKMMSNRQKRKDKEVLAAVINPEQTVGATQQLKNKS